MTGSLFSSQHRFRQTLLPQGSRVGYTLPFSDAVYGVSVASFTHESQSILPRERRGGPRSDPLQWAERREGQHIQPPSRFAALTGYAEGSAPQLATAKTGPLEQIYSPHSILRVPRDPVKQQHDASLTFTTLPGTQWPAPQPPHAPFTTLPGTQWPAPQPPHDRFTTLPGTQWPAPEQAQDRFARTTLLRQLEPQRFVPAKQGHLPRARRMKQRIIPSRQFPLASSLPNTTVPQPRPPPVAHLKDPQLPELLDKTTWDTLRRTLEQPSTLTEDTSAYDTVLQQERYIRLKKLKELGLILKTKTFERRQAFSRSHRFSTGCGAYRLISDIANLPSGGPVS